MPVSLETIDLSKNNFSGGLPAEWSSLTNLKELNMANCDLYGGCGLSRYTAQKRIEKPTANLFRTEF